MEEFRDVLGTVDSAFYVQLGLLFGLKSEEVSHMVKDKPENSKVALLNIFIQWISTQETTDDIRAFLGAQFRTLGLNTQADQLQGTCTCD